MKMHGPPGEKWGIPTSNDNEILLLLLLLFNIHTYILEERIPKSGQIIRDRAVRVIYLLFVIRDVKHIGWLEPARRNPYN